LFSGAGAQLGFTADYEVIFRRGGLVSLKAELKMLQRDIRGSQSSQLWPVMRQVIDQVTDPVIENDLIITV
jgi:hypothetical protein